MKVPSRMNPRKRYWKPRTDRRNEALDCTVYSLYLIRQQRLHLRRAVQWDLAEMRLRQGDLLGADQDSAAPVLPAPASPAETEPAIDPVQTSAPLPIVAVHPRPAMTRRAGGVSRRV